MAPAINFPPIYILTYRNRAGIIHGATGVIFYAFVSPRHATRGAVGHTRVGHSAVGHSLMDRRVWHRTLG